MPTWNSWRDPSRTSSARFAPVRRFGFPMHTFQLLLIFLVGGIQCSNSVETSDPRDSAYQIQIRGLEEDNQSLQSALEMARNELRELYKSRERVAARNRQQSLTSATSAESVCNVSGISFSEARRLVSAISETCSMDLEDKHLGHEDESIKHLYEKVVGTAKKGGEDPFFLLNLATFKMNQGDVASGISFFDQHFKLFSNSSEGRAVFQRRLASLDRDFRSSDNVFLISHPETRRLRYPMLLEMAAELEKGYLIPEKRRLASILLEMYLASAPYDSVQTPNVWYRLGQLREADSRPVEALRFYQIARRYSSEILQYGEAVARATKSMHTLVWERPNPLRVFVTYCGREMGVQGVAMKELHLALKQMGMKSTFVWTLGGRRKKKSQESQESQDFEATLMQPDALQPGDVIIVAGGYPLPPQWHNAAIAKQVSLAVWVFSETELQPANLLLPFQPSLVGWTEDLLTSAQEGGDVVKSPSRMLGLDDSYIRLATSHSLITHVSAPLAGLLVPPFSKQVYDDALRPRNISMNTEESSSIWEKQDLVLVRGEEEAATGFIHRTILALHLHGFCTPSLATVTDVIAGSPASQAGLRLGDRILALGTVSGGETTPAESLSQEIARSRGKTLKIVVARDKSPVPAEEIAVFPHQWNGEEMLGCKFAFASQAKCSVKSDAGSDASYQFRPLILQFTGEGGTLKDLSLQLQSAKVMLSLSRCTRGGIAPELLAALYDVNSLIPSSCPGTVDWPLSSRLIFDEKKDLIQGAALLAKHINEYSEMAIERKVLKDFVSDLPSQMRSSAFTMLQGSRQLFYTVALDSASETAACTFILSVKLTHPLAVVEVFVHDITLFYRKHSSLIHIWKERGLWNDVHISQIPDSVVEHASGISSDEAFHVYASLAVRPTMLHGVRSFSHACLLRPDHLVLPSSDFVSKLSNYSWPSSTYFAWSSKGSMQLPLCYNPAGFQVKISKVTISPPAGSESASKYLFRTMMSVAGLPMHKRLGDVGTLCSSFSHSVPLLSNSVAQAPTSARGAIAAMVTHPAWAAMEPFISSHRRDAVRAAAGLSQHILSGNAEADCQAVCHDGAGSSSQDHEAIDGSRGDDVESLPADAEKLRQQVIRLQRELSESTKMQAGWKAVAEQSQAESRELRQKVEELQAQALPPEQSQETNAVPFSPTRKFERDTVGVVSTSRASSLGTVSESLSVAQQMLKASGIKTATPSPASSQSQSPPQTADDPSPAKLAASTKIVVLSGRTSNQLVEEEQWSWNQAGSKKNMEQTTASTTSVGKKSPTGTSISDDESRTSLDIDAIETVSAGQMGLPTNETFTNSHQEQSRMNDSTKLNVTFAVPTNATESDVCLDGIAKSVESSLQQPQTSEVLPTDFPISRDANVESQLHTPDSVFRRANASEEVDIILPAGPRTLTSAVEDEAADHPEAQDIAAALQTDPKPAPDCPPGFSCGTSVSMDQSTDNTADLSALQPQQQEAAIFQPIETMTETIQKAEAVFKSTLVASARAQQYKEAREELKVQGKEDQVRRSKDSLRATPQKGSQAMFRRAFSGAEDRASSLRTDAPSAHTAAARTSMSAEQDLSTDEKTAHVVEEAVSAGAYRHAGGSTSPGGPAQEEVEGQASGVQLPNVPSQPATPSQSEQRDASGHEARECGIGVGLGVSRSGEWRINRIIAGGAAERVGGLRAGDRLLEIEGVKVQGLPPPELGKLVKGPEGSGVSLLVRRTMRVGESESEDFQVKVPRACE